MIHYFFILLFVFGCSHHSQNKKNLTHKFIAQKIFNKDFPSIIDTLDIESDSDDELIWTIKNNLFIYSPSSMKTKTISIDEDILKIIVLHQSNTIIMITQTKIYRSQNYALDFVDFLPSDHVLATFIYQINNDNKEDFLLLFASDEEWHYDFYLSCKDHFCKQSLTIKKSLALFPPQIFAINTPSSSQVVIKADFNLLCFKLQDNIYQLEQTIPFSSMNNQIIIASLDNTEKIDIIKLLPEKIVIVSNEKNIQLNLPNTLNIGTYVKDVNMDGFQDILCFCIVNKTPSLFYYIGHGKIEIVCALYQFINNDGNFEPEPQNVYHYKISFPALPSQNVKKQKILEIKDIDNDLSIDAIIWDSEKKNILFYYDALTYEKNAKFPPYMNEMLEKVSRQIYATERFFPIHLPQVVIPLYLNDSISNILFLKRKDSLHDIIVLFSGKEIHCLLPF